MSVDADMLKLWREVATASTPNLGKGLFRDDTHAGQLAQFKETIEKHPEGQCWAVCCPVGDGTPIEDEALFAAITGNGPTSEANARFFAGARDAFLMAIDEIERLKGLLAAASLRDIEMCGALLKACDLAESASEVITTEGLDFDGETKSFLSKLSTLRKLAEP